MFNKMKVRAAPNFQPSNMRFTKISSHFGRVYADAMERTIEVSHGRGPEFRPSAFPLCPILIYMQLKQAAQTGYFASAMNAAGGFFTSVGTAAHENIQYYIGESGNVYGDWKCKNPKCKRCLAAKNIIDENGKVIRVGKLTRKATCNNKCPTCKEAMEYVEIEINYRGLKGHVDCIYRMPNGNYWVADYKTTTKNSLKGNKLPKSEHLMQLPTYCYVLEKKYKMKIEGFSLLYFSRDNPFEFYEHAEAWDARWRKRIRELIANQRERYSDAANAFYHRKPKLAIGSKPCRCADDYDKLMPAYEPCPMIDVCFKRKELLARMEPDYTREQRDNLIARIPNFESYIEEE